MSSESGTAQRPAKRQRHLMDPHAPRAPRPTRKDSARLTHVQQWVMSVLAVTTILHMSAGLVLASMFLENPRPGAEVGLNVIASVFGVLAVAAGLAIHKKSVFSWWLLLGIVPGIIGVLLLNR